MKKYFQVWMIALTLFCLLTGQCVTAAEDLDAPENWDIGKSISLKVEAAYGNEILEKGVEVFDFQVNEIYITEKTVLENGVSLSLLLVLEDGMQMDSAVSLLKEDVRFTNVQSNAPAQTVNTLRLQADSDSVKVGETLTIRPDGELNAAPSYDMPYETIEIMIDGYDPQREYTPADFPQYAFSSIEKIPITEDSAFFSLKLEEPGYYNFYRAIHALAMDSAVLYVHSGEYIPVPDVIVPPVWKISDPSVAVFTTSVPGESGEMVLQGLQPGKVTVTYIPSLGDALKEDYAVACEITVIGENAAPDTTETGDIINETTGNSTPGSSSPKTGDQEFAVMSLLGLASFIGMAVSGVIWYKKKNCR